MLVLCVEEEVSRTDVEVGTELESRDIEAGSLGGQQNTSTNASDKRDKQVKKGSGEIKDH
jgi:hypothetical protein